jgi:hypothetical protein
MSVRVLVGVLLASSCGASPSQKQHHGPPVTTTPPPALGRKHTQSVLYSDLARHDPARFSPLSPGLPSDKEGENERGKSTLHHAVTADGEADVLHLSFKIGALISSKQFHCANDERSKLRLDSYATILTRFF